MRRSNDDVVVRLPNEVVELLADKGVPQTATAIRRTEGADMPLTTRGCIALADRMAAERRVYEEARKLDEVRGEAATVEDQGKQIAALSDEVRKLKQERDELRGELTRQTAKSAMAVSSGSDR